MKPRQGNFVVLVGTFRLRNLDRCYVMGRFTGAPADLSPGSVRPVHVGGSRRRGRCGASLLVSSFS